MRKEIIQKDRQPDPNKGRTKPISAEVGTVTSQIGPLCNVDLPVGGEHGDLIC